MENNAELQVIQENTGLTVFGNTVQFEHSQRVSKMLSMSSLIPKDYQNNIQNCMIALEMSNRMGISPLMVMQNLYIVQGKPSWASPFIIGALNACGRFTPIRFKIEGTGENMSCYAYCSDKKTGEELKGTKITMQMAKGEGWTNKSGSKWLTMPEQMIQYRAGTFFGRLYAPDILMGMHTVEEVQDVYEASEPIDKEQERVVMMLGDCKTQADLKKIQANIPAKYIQLFNDKMSQLAA